MSADRAMDDAPPSWSEELICEHFVVLKTCGLCSRFEDGAAEALIERAVARWRTVKLSLAWEEQTGYDSIPTIERVYERTGRGRTDSGAYKCVWPKCGFARRDSVALWRHVHTAHGSNSLPELAHANSHA